MTQLDKDQIKDTIHLPKTDFPMRAGLPKKEPEIIANWWDKKAGNDLYKEAMETAKDRETFLMHWGPPFANGHLHMGHAMTYILKDVVVRSQFGLGKRAPSVTGWDCHGLPIEWKVEEGYRKAGKDKDEVSPLEFRKECREYAQQWKEIQQDEMKRFGIMADWDNPYLTMDFKSESAIAAEVLKFVDKGLIYSALRPVMWSIPEHTALAEAEIEYKEHKSTTIYVAFPVKKASSPILDDAHLMIWTTTPWTIPSNRMIGLHDDIEYGVYHIKAQSTGDDNPSSIGQNAVGKKLVIATQLAATVEQHLKITEWEQIGTLNGSEIAGTTCAHPFADLHDYYGFDVITGHGDFVTTDAGTGLVHIAPSHGKDDFFLGKQYGIGAEETVLGNGTYHQDVGLFAGLAVYTDEGKEGPANGMVIKTLAQQGLVIGKSSFRHEYPHSWRSKSPLIFRATPQWYIELDNSGLRQKGLDAIEDTQWFPPQSINRIKAMVSGRPDWCISRQRVWGVPIAIFVNKETEEILNDADVNARILAALNEEGADAWYKYDAAHFLGSNYSADDYTQVMDVIDVWFESGSTHAFVCEAREDLKWPADLYFEGSDQHRGWFQSSLLQSCGTRGRAPYNQVLTHGFILDAKGYKMSKSQGNVMDPFKVCDQYGADILRLWAVNMDYQDDVNMGPEILKHQADLYRRLRNTLRYLLGNLGDLKQSEMVDLNDTEKLPELEQWVLHRLNEMDKTVKQGYKGYQFNRMYAQLMRFCGQDLSAFYFDIRKDRLYCDDVKSYERRATRTVLAKIFECITSWLAPVLVFTTEEAWAMRPEGIFIDDDKTSNHLRTFPEIPDTWNNEELAAKWARLSSFRDVVLGALEPKRADKTIGSSLAAAPVLIVENEVDKTLIESINFADLCIISDYTVEMGTGKEDDFAIDDIKGFKVRFDIAAGHKCGRCWKTLQEVKQDDDLCKRCSDAVAQEKKAA